MWMTKYTVIWEGVKKWDPTVYELASQVKMLNTVLKKNDVEE